MSKFVITHHTGETKPSDKFKGVIPGGHDWSWRLVDEDGGTVVKGKRMLGSEEECREDIENLIKNVVHTKDIEVTVE